MNQVPPVTQQPGVQYVQYPPGQQQNVSNVNQTNTNITIGMSSTALNVRDWATGKFGCCADCLSCWLVMLFPQCYVCYLSSLLGEDCWMPLCVPMSPLPLRVKLRTKEKIHGTICHDCCAVTCCYLCVLCQMKREHEIIMKTQGR